jgi:hypothetical protein
MSSQLGSDPAVDQWLAAMRDAERAWPHNAWLVADEGISEAVRRAPAGPWVSLRPDEPTLLWPATGEARAVSLYHEVDALARSMAPRKVVRQTCDRCLRVRLPDRAVLIAAPPRIVALILCSPCAKGLSDLGEANMGAKIRWTQLKEH